MAEDGDLDSDALIGRTDALLRKHKPRPNPAFAGSPAPSLDIPVLTEVIDPETVKAAMPPARQLDFEQLALRVHEDVLRGLQPQLNALFDKLLAQTLADLLVQVSHGLEAELRATLQETVRQAVAAAIEHEMQRLGAAPAVRPAEPRV